MVWSLRSAFKWLLLVSHNIITQKPYKTDILGYWIPTFRRESNIGMQQRPFIGMMDNTVLWTFFCFRQVVLQLCLDLRPWRSQVSVDILLACHEECEATNRKNNLKTSIPEMFYLLWTLWTHQSSAKTLEIQASNVCMTFDFSFWIVKF